MPGERIYTFYVLKDLVKLFSLVYQFTLIPAIGNCVYFPHQPYVSSSILYQLPNTELKEKKNHIFKLS